MEKWEIRKRIFVYKRVKKEISVNDAFLVQLLQPTVTTIEEEIGQLLGFEIEAKPETRAKKPMSESLYDQAALTLYYTQPEIQAGVDTVSEFASRSIRWDSKNVAQDKMMRTFWKKEMMRQKIEMMIANGFIFGRSVFEPFPSWKVRDPQRFFKNLYKPSFPPLP